MMVTIHGLPIGIKYADIKQLIKDKCTIQEFILDNLVVDDDKHSKKIRVGLADATEGSVVMTQLDRLWFQGHQLTVVPFAKSKPPAPIQQDNRGQDGYQNQSAPKGYGNNTQNFTSRDQGHRPRDDYGPPHDGTRPEFRSQGPERANFGPPRNDGRQDARRPDGNRPDFRSHEDRSFSGPRNEQFSSFGAEQHRMAHNQTPNRSELGSRGPHQNVPPRLEQNQGPRRDPPFEDHAARNQITGPQDPWASNQVQWSSNTVEETGPQYRQHSGNEFDLGPRAPIRVRDFGNQEKFNATAPQQQRQDSWLPNNVGMPDPRSTIIPQRVVEVTDNPIVRQHHDPNSGHARMGKPMTISKDKFQGPTQYSFEPEPASPFRVPSAKPSQPPVWNAQSQPQKSGLPQQRNPFDRNAPFASPPEVGRFIDKPEDNNRFRNTNPEDGRGDYRRSPIGKRYKSPPRNERQYSPSRRRLSPPGDGRVHRSPQRRSPPGRIAFSPARKVVSPVQRVVSPSVRLIAPSQRGFEPIRRDLSPNRRNSPPGRRISPPGRRISPPGRRVSPPGRRVSPAERIIIPTFRRMGSPRRMSSPPGRKISPPRSRFSPSRFSPGKKSTSPTKRGFSPSRRDISPSRRVVSPVKRRISPLGRRISPPGRRISPPGRRISPPRRGISPPGRRISPQRRRSPGRYSPSALYDDISPKAPPPRFQKDVRPAYEPLPAQPKFPSNYRPSVNENVSYPMHGQGDSKVSTWQPNTNFAKDDRRPPMEKRPLELSRVEWETKRSRSRSPMRRESTSRDRFRRSPSPRTSKVWKKRDSPDAPPPPAWPGGPELSKSEKKERDPVWETPNFAPLKDERKKSRIDEPIGRSMPQPERKPHWDMTKQHRPEESFQDRRNDPIRRDDRHKIPSPFDNFRLDEDEKRQDFRRPNRSELKTPGPISRFDRHEPIPQHADHRSAKSDDFERYSFDKHNEGRNDSYLQRHEDGPKSHLEAAKTNRKEAVDIISASLFDKYNITPLRARDELKLQLSKIVFDMTGSKIMSPDEVVMKFYQHFSNQQQEKIVRDVIFSLPSHLRPQKRIGEDIPELASKHPRTDSNLSSFVTQDQMPSYALVPHPEYGLVQQPIVYPPELAGQQVMPQMETGIGLMQQMEGGIGSGFAENNDRTLYLCKDDFDQISPHQAEALRDFIVSQIFEATVATGWAPTFLFKGLKSLHRYEIIPENDDSSDWLMNLDFSKFAFFNVLVYTKEELWYERAAIWLPGHSKCRNIEPLKKLQLQNRHLEGVNIHKWKLVKKILSAKGTRIYVDMPPSSSQALKKCKMVLSYELQQVNVFLKADAVDKDSFDMGVREDSVADPNVILAAIQNAPMPFVHDELSIVKICFKGSKMVTVDQAKKMKEMVIYHLFKYLQQPTVKLRTDFTKYGFCQPGFFAVQPVNAESKKWLLGLDIAKRRSAAGHTVATSNTAQPKALPKKTTSALKKQSSIPNPKTKEAPRKTEDRPTEDKASQQALHEEAATSGHYELSPTMAAALNDELNVIMEKLEQVLPKTASNPTEKYVLDKMTQVVCADFCNVLGLNVAKRTLNVHNGLYVKIKFDREVAANTLHLLRKRHNIVQMRAVANSSTTFLAVMKDFADFDALCFTKDTKIGEHKFITAPCYKFTKCTDNLKHGNFVKTTKTNIPTKIIEEKTVIAQETPNTTNSKNNEQKGAQKTPPKKETSVATTEKSQNVASTNKVPTQNKSKQDLAKITNSDKIKLANIESSSQDSKSQAVKPVASQETHETIESQDMAMLLADGIVVDECMGSDDE